MNDCRSVRAMMTNPFSFRFPTCGAWLRSDNEGSPLGIYDLQPAPLQAVETQNGRGSRLIGHLEVPQSVPLPPVSLTTRTALGTGHAHDQS